MGLREHIFYLEYKSRLLSQLTIEYTSFSHTLSISSVKLRYNNPFYNNIPRYTNIFSVYQKLYFLINVFHFNNMIYYNNIWGADQTYCYRWDLLYLFRRF